MREPTWLKFNVEFIENGSDADTVSLLLSSMRGCVIVVDGTKVHYSHLDAHGSLQVCGTKYGTDKQVSIPLTSETTITIL
jgi:hypothetical protein